MSLFDVLQILLLGLVGVAVVLITSRANELIGSYRLLSWMNGRLDSLKGRGQKATSEKEQQAIQETLLACERLREINFQEWNFKSATLSLVEKIAYIYHPRATVPIEQARFGDVLEALQEANQKVLNVLHLPRLDYVTRFRVAQIFESYKGDEKKQAGIKSRLLRPFILKLQTFVVRSLLVQWLVLVGEAAVKVYGGNPEEQEVEAEEILAEWDSLEDAPDVLLPENVKKITESSKKEILFSPTSVSWRKAGQIYYTLADQIARHYHSESSNPIYEVRVCDLLKSVADSLEGMSRLGQKPVLNKLKAIRISQLTQVKDLALPLGQNKIMEWVDKYQVGRIAKWSHTLYRTLQKKQPGILLRDVVFGVVKEGGKRWLVLYLHGKIAVEANKLYSR